MPANLIDKERIRPSQVPPEGPSAQNRQNFCVPTLSPRSALKHADFPHGLSNFGTTADHGDLAGTSIATGSPENSKPDCQCQAPWEVGRTPAGGFSTRSRHGRYKRSVCSYRRVVP
jgi:hypothetical protein